jgi:hypothetical protein
MYTVTVSVFSFLLIAFCACNNAGKNSDIPVTQPVNTDSPAININYVDSKTGDTILIFLYMAWELTRHIGTVITPQMQRLYATLLDTTS